MAGQGEERTATTTGGGQESAGEAGATGDTLEQHEPEAEQESAAAMDADVPQPSGAEETTEGQPS